MERTCTLFSKRYWSVILLITGLLAGTALAVTQPAPRATSGLAANAQTVVLAALPQAAAVSSARAAGQPLNPLSPAQYQAMLNQVRSAPATAKAEVNGPANLSTYTVNPALKKFNGITEYCAGVTPSDMGLAVGGSYVVQAVNSCIAVYSKAGAVFAGFPKAMWQFLGFASSTYTTDPRVTFDLAKNRFILVVISYDTQWNIHIAASATANPTGAWYVYKLAYGSNIPDYPTLGFDRRVVYSSVNVFNSAGNTYYGPNLFAFNKTNLYAGASLGWVSWSGFYACDTSSCQLEDTLQPMNLVNKTDNPRVTYILSNQNGNTTGLFGGCGGSVGCYRTFAWAVYDALNTGAPGWSSNVFYNGFSSYYPLPASQPGCFQCIETIDMRITGKVPYVNGSLWPTWETAVYGSYSSVPMTAEYRPVISTAQPAVLQGSNLMNSLMYDDGYSIVNSGAAYFGAAMPDPEGNLVMGFSYSDTSTYPGFAYITRRISQGYYTWNGGYDTGYYLQSGQGQYIYNGNRWGDYFAAEQEPGTANIWLSGMFSRTDGAWGTVIGKVAYTSQTQR